MIDNQSNLGLSEEGPLMHRTSRNRNHLKRYTHKLPILDSFCQMLWPIRKSGSLYQICCHRPSVSSSQFKPLEK